MKLIISPAKSLNFQSPVPVKECSEYFFTEEASELNKLLKKFTAKELGKLLKVSDKLAQLNWERNAVFSVNNSLERSRQAVYAFNGDVYNGLDAYSFSKSQVKLLQEKLFILSGLYGLLKPLDMIQPYRLEMGTNLENSIGKNLYDFWRDKITTKLNEQMQKGEVLVNLASNEYFKAINKKQLNAKIITPIFKDYKNGKLKVISFFAKKARGMFARFVIENGIETVEDLKSFDVERYQFDEGLSTDDELVFTR